MEVNQAVVSGFAALGAIIFWLIGIAFNCGMGAIAVYMAKKRGLQAVPAFFMGFFMSFVALFVVALTPVRQQDNKQEY